MLKFITFVFLLTIIAGSCKESKQPTEEQQKVLTGFVGKWHFPAQPPPNKLNEVIFVIEQRGSRMYVYNELEPHKSAGFVSYDKKTKRLIRNFRDDDTRKALEKQYPKETVEEMLKLLDGYIAFDLLDSTHMEIEVNVNGKSRFSTGDRVTY